MPLSIATMRATKKKYLFLAMIIPGIALFGIFGARMQKKIDNLLSQAKASNYLPYSTEQSQGDSDWLALLFGKNQREAGRKSASLAGWQFYSVGLINKTNVLVDAQKRGWGAYVWRANRLRREVWLQAPHGGSDRWTENIAADMFYENRVIAGYARNTAPRYLQDKTMNADLSHIEHSFFNQFQNAIIQQSIFEQQPRARIVQLHGFDPDKRGSMNAALADIIISNGTREPSQYAKRVHQCLIDLGWNAALYPRDVQELGGTSNAQVALSKSKKFQRFLHIEMSQALRATLKDNRHRRKEFAQCLDN